MTYPTTPRPLGEVGGARRTSGFRRSLALGGSTFDGSALHGHLALGPGGDAALLEVPGPRGLGGLVVLDRRADVVALFVVGVLAEVLLVLGGHHAALRGLLDRQADPAALEAEVDDLDPELLTGSDDLLGQVDVVGGHLGDVHEALDPLAHLDEGAEGHELGDPAVDELADPVGGGELLPRVLLGGLERQADALALQVHVEDLDRDLVPDGHDRARVVDVLPGQLGHVDEAVHAAEVDEGAEVHDARHHAGADLAGLEVGEEVLALLLLGLLEPGPAGQDHVVAVLVQLDDLRLEGATDVGRQVADAAELDEAGRQEAAQADVEDEAALDDLDDRAADDAVLLLDALDVAPGPLVLGPLLGEDQATLLVLLGEDQGLDLVAERHDLVRVDVVADRQFAAGDDALGLVADVEQDLVPVDLHHRALDDLAVLDRDERPVDEVLEAAAEVVSDDLAGGVGAVFGEGAHARDGCLGGFGVGLVGGRGVVGQGSRPSGIGNRGHVRARRAPERGAKANR